MQNSLSGIFFDNNGNKHSVSEAYARKDHPEKIFRKDNKGLWRCYCKNYRIHGRTFFRFIGFKNPDFDKGNNS